MEQMFELDVQVRANSNSSSKELAWITQSCFCTLRFDECVTVQDPM